MLDTHGFEPLGGVLKGLAIRAQSAHADVLRTLRFFVNARHREAAFFHVRDTVGFEQFRVDKRAQSVACG